MNRSAGSLDTNAVLRLLLNDIPEQHTAVLSLIEKSSASLSVADIAIVEVVFALERYYRFSRSQVVEAIDGLSSLPAINCNRALFDKALPSFALHPNLSFEDCCLVAYAELQDAAPLWTFDKKLATKMGGAKLLAAS